MVIVLMVPVAVVFFRIGFQHMLLKLHTEVRDLV